MSTSASQEIEAFRKAQNEGEREYWTRQIIIRRLRLHDARNQELLRREVFWLTKVTAGAVATALAGLSMFAVAMRWS